MRVSERLEGIVKGKPTEMMVAHDNFNHHHQQQRRRRPWASKGPAHKMPTLSCLIDLVARLSLAAAMITVSSPFTFASAANSDANRLYEDLMMSYNRFVRPVQNDSDTLVVKLGLKLSQLIDVVSRRRRNMIHLVATYIFNDDNKNSSSCCVCLAQNLRYQMMTTIVWMEQEWTDYKLKWDPDDYGGIAKVSNNKSCSCISTDHAHAASIGLGCCRACAAGAA